MSVFPQKTRYVGFERESTTECCKFLQGMVGLLGSRKGRLSFQKQCNLWAGEVAKRLRGACCSCRGPEFSSQHPHAGSQPPVTPVPGGSDVLFWSMWHTYIHSNKPPIHIKSKSKSLFFKKKKKNTILKNSLYFYERFCS